MMTTRELRATCALAGIFAVRMLGLFIILPIFSPYAATLPDTTPVLIGLALGIYGLTQACFQIPLGMLSDRVGRKPIIAAGLIIFAGGSMMAAMAHSIAGIIIGRALQGAGAIGSTVIASVADLTLEENRTKAMAIIGSTIGLAFLLAMVLGPILNPWLHLSGIFALTAVLALLGIVILYTLVPTVHTGFHRDAEPIPALFKKLLSNPELLRLDFGICALHAMLTALFIAVPLLLTSMGNFNATQQGYFYLPILVAAFLAMLPFIILAEKHRHMKKVFLGAISLLLIAQLGLLIPSHSLWSIGIDLFLFFTAFTLLEACLPSLVSKFAPAAAKGTATGIYSSAQFLGIFLGGVIGGYAYEHFGMIGVLSFGIALAVIWLILASSMRQPLYLKTILLKIGYLNATQAQALAQHLAQTPGVAEATLVREDGIAYLKIDNKIIGHEQLLRMVESYSTLQST
jgi:predicted MFS family arabinose efflux permease